MDIDIETLVAEFSKRLVCQGSRLQLLSLVSLQWWTIKYGVRRRLAAKHSDRIRQTIGLSKMFNKNIKTKY
jgi:hypothetical protein